MGGTGCDLVRGKLVESLQRDLSGTYHYLVGLKDALVGWGYGNYEGMKDLGVALTLTHQCTLQLH